MKNKFLLLLISLLCANGAFASQEPTVISDLSEKQATQQAFADLNKYTDNFFTPAMKKTVKPSATAEIFGMSSSTTQNHGSIPPVKKLRIMWEERNKPKTAVVEEKPVESTNQALLDCDLMEYFAERTELEATGNVDMLFPKNNSEIKADKIVYNQTSNLIKAYGNVVLIHDGQKLYGDYMQVDMNEENAIMDDPTSDIFQIRSRAKKGYMYGDKIIQDNGNLLVTKKTLIKVKSEMFGPDLDAMYVSPEDKSQFRTDSHGELFKIKTDDLIINAKKEHDTITLKNAEIYYDGKKICKLPSMTVHTNKAQDYVEAGYPEIGTMSNMGLYAGPGFVFDTPMGTNLKVIPVFNYDSGSFGGGAIAKFKSATGKVDMAYGTANKIFIARGKQRLDDHLFFQYGANAYMDDWFMGYRMPGAMGEVFYENDAMVKNFLAKDLPLTYTHRIAAGYMQDYRGDGKFLIGPNDDGGGIGTTRFKYMAEICQNIYNFNKGDSSAPQVTDLFSAKHSKDDILHARLDMVMQGSAAVYGTGDTQMVARFGPRLHTQYKYWMQDVGYFMSGYQDNTPLLYYDRYMYGRSNVYLRESLRVSKYLTLSWFGSFNLSQDSWDGNMLQENGFYFAIGPDDVKLNIGYDTVRQQSFVTMAFALDAKGTNIEYKKMVIKNPDKLGKNKDGSSPNDSSFSGGTSAEDANEPQRAEVIDLKQQM